MWRRGQAALLIILVGFGLVALVASSLSLQQKLQNSNFDAISPEDLNLPVDLSGLGGCGGASQWAASRGYQRHECVCLYADGYAAVLRIGENKYIGALKQNNGEWRQSSQPFRLTKGTPEEMCGSQDIDVEYVD